MKEWLKKVTIPIFSIKITWGGSEDKVQVEKVKVGPVPVLDKEKKDKKKEK